VTTDSKEEKPVWLDGRYWAIPAFLACGIGLLLGILGLAMIGAGVSGSGCGKQCSDSVMLFAAIGSGLLGLAILSALVSISLIWFFRYHPPRLWLDIAITLVDLLVLLSAGPALALLVSL